VVLDRMTNRQLLVVGTATVALGLVVGAVVMDSRKARGHRFDRKQWRLATPDEDDRLAMAEDLMARGKLDGMPKARVIKLLGEGGATDRFPGGHLAYRLGLERDYMPVDYEWLVIRFDANDKVERYWIAKE
jgi:hypothetical protein